MDSTPQLRAIDNSVLAIKRNCYLVQHLLNEKVADLMVGGTETEYMDTDTKAWIIFLADLNKCMDQANELKPYLASSGEIHFKKTGIDIATLDRPFFIRKYTAIEKLLIDLRTSAEEVLDKLPFQEMQPFSMWKKELSTIAQDYTLLIKSMKRHAKLR